MLCSIVIPVYNNAQHLPACLDSIRGQDQPDWECILVDDGSTDDSVAVCRRYCEIDRRFHLLTLQHAGGGVARDTGFRQAKGAFIFYSDADDVLHPSLLSAALGALERSGAPFVHFDCEPFSGDFDPAWIQDVSGASQEMVMDPLCMSLKNGWGRAMWRYLYRREALEGVWSGSRFTRCVDRFFCFSVLKKNLPCVRLHATLYFYRQHAQSQVHRPLSQRDVDGYENYICQIAASYRECSGKLRLIRRLEFVSLLKSVFRKVVADGNPEEMTFFGVLFDRLRQKGVLGYSDFSVKWAFRLWKSLRQIRTR